VTDHLTKNTMKIAFIGVDALWLLGVIDDILSQPDVFATPEPVFMECNIDRAATNAAPRLCEFGQVGR